MSLLHWTPENAMENASGPLLNICIIFACLETFFIIAFMFSWHYNNSNSNNTKAVYIFVLIGYLFCFGGVVMGILKITIGGAGVHAKSLDPKTIRTMLQLVKAHEIIYVLSIPFPKLAIMCLYFRLFTSKFAHCVLYMTGFIVVGAFLFGLVAPLANCRPFHSFWDRKVPMTCTMDIMAAFRYYSIPNIATDVAMVIIPIPAVWKLHVGLLTKLGVLLTFLIMTFGIVTAVLRFVAFLDSNLFHDITYLSVTTTGWTIIEPGVYLIAATMPTLRPLLRKMFKRVTHTLPSSQRRTSCFRSTVDSDSKDIEADSAHPRLLRSKPSEREFVQTIGRVPSRALLLDEYHSMQGRLPTDRSPQDRSPQGRWPNDSSPQDRRPNTLSPLDRWPNDRWPQDRSPQSPHLQDRSLQAQYAQDRSPRVPYSPNMSPRVPYSPSTSPQVRVPKNKWWQDRGAKEQSPKERPRKERAVKERPPKERGSKRHRSADEESMVCADAIIHESMGQQGRNPDGTLHIWSLQPSIRLSPLRTSFLGSSK
ncbi:hypothetical protein BDV95DRAFT_395790 [Massariosphaeria phaeospora]|uniref:Rhodopsin domain-containing protein n=1 Tax=Massariosphaeria phaeospora TaxID=100035 RepID=A0A7C8MBI4_9PLEO|nr:hypothetical protein BDV95DRAFT_395790 [Massariosphaeria phaeospora]